MYNSEYDVLFAILAVVFFSTIVMSIAAYIVTSIFYMKLFAKANVRAWKAWVPYVNTWKFFELGGYPGALCLLSVASTVANMLYLVPLYSSLPYIDSAYYGGNYSYLGFTSLISIIIYMVGSILSIVSIVFLCLSAYQIGRKLGKDGSWVVLYIFVSIVWLGILAFNKATWNDSLGRPARGQERPPSWPPYNGGGGYGQIYH